MIIRILSTTLFFLYSFTLIGQQIPADISLLLRDNQKRFGLTPQDISEYEVSDTYLTKQLQVTHVYLIQKHMDIKVFNGILNLNFKEADLLSFGNRWVKDLAGQAPTHIPSISATAAVQRAGEHLGYAETNPVLLKKEKNSFNQDIKFQFEDKSLSREDILADLVWLPQGKDPVKLCWMINLHELQKENIWIIFIDAHTGVFVEKHNQVIECSFETSPRASDQHYLPSMETISFSSMIPDSAYNVFPLKIESPNHGDRTIEVTPWVAAGPGNEATTLNWHDDGTTTYTSTRGNNVHAYEDIDNNNLPGYSPDTANLRFDYPLDPFLPPAENQAAAITNLFYWNNIIHDIMYQYGFDEVSGNFQNDNLGRGGLGVDYVRAEGLDGGGSNNANFFTPADGSKPRMQMYLWSEVSSVSPLTINVPASIAGSMWSVESDFSVNNKLQDVGLTTGDLVLVNDAVGNTHLACGELSNEADISGKIAVIDRGTCSFVIKVKKVQDLGAIAAIVINNDAGSPIPMGGSDNTITIPAVMVGLNDGNILKAVLDTSVINASLDSVPGNIIPDGDYDNGIITHEYGHGISNRLTGGPSSSNCLTNEEQMGEGWSDFFGLMLTTDWATAQPTDRRGIGTYVLGQPTDGTGIRTYPYTTDMEVNPFTYADVADAPGTSNNPSPHFIGSVWATMLWDMTWEIINMAGVDEDIYQGSGGNNIALSLVINGLKLQPCNPGFVDGRDAILLADEILYGGLYKCAIWKAFADRGLGVSADQGSSDNFEDGVEAFDSPDGITLSSGPSISLSSEGQEVTFTIQTICGCTAKSDLVVKDYLGDNLSYIPGSGGTLNGNVVEFTADTLGVLDTLSFSYHAFVSACSATDSIQLSEDDAEGPDQYISIKLAGTGTKQWVKNTNHFESPTQSWYAQDYTTLGDFALTLSTGVTTTGPIEISFKHKYETEDAYDGGVVEFTFDNGSTWQDAGPYFTQNGYQGSINTSGTDSPLAGREAYTGDSESDFGPGFILSRITLCSDADQTLKIRFRFAADGGVGGPGINGWYIDDIQIVQLSGIVNGSSVTAENILLDSIGYCLKTKPFSGTTVFVDRDADGARNGQNWMGAMQYLPMALEVAGCREVDSIFVAEGIYLPNLQNDRGTGFVFSDSISVFGGFPSGGSSFDLRDPEYYTTTLSGDVGIEGDTSDNVFHIIKVSSSQKDILLNGFSLTHANANGDADDSRGAAIFCEGELKLDRLKMLDNYGITDGRIIFNRGDSANLTLKDCLIYTPSSSVISLLNQLSGILSIQGTTQMIEE
jgi:extracellular elastinolytic metalloproteinase